MEFQDDRGLREARPREVQLEAAALRMNHRQFYPGQVFFDGAIQFNKRVRPHDTLNERRTVKLFKHSLYCDIGGNPPIGRNICGLSIQQLDIIFIPKVFNPGLVVALPITVADYYPRKLDLSQFL